MMEYLTLAISKAVSSGESGVQTIVPDGKYIGDLWFITNVSNEIIVVLCWDGYKWLTEHDCVKFELPTQTIEGLKC